MSELVQTSNLADRLDAWSAWTTWTVLAAGGLALISADRIFPAVGMGPLFIPLIALAGWRLGLRASCFVTIIACFLNIFPHHVHEVGLNPDVAVARGIIRFSAYGFTLAVIHALRRTYDRERVRATHDALTNALNRAAFDRELETLLDAREPGDRAVALAMIDVDDFKRINDTHGHGVGDHVLRELTAAATSALHGRGRLFRLAGDEFAALIPIASTAAGRPTIERFHQELSAALGQSRYPTTVSMGGLVFQPSSLLDRAALMHEADGHMYAGKAAGKGRVRIAAPWPVAIANTDPVPTGAELVPAV
ncbi:GGDEF domain-containing protein [Methylobacterium pseudosasicola]|uniref:diguanylate cyclase n=1 Tax=Methylobacterium pseudosasicola TaxID=582667 RepID=A0A1I4R858_9HYPH|nr:GGDEF domain-containing protein [Methylobacterium pseudosasicola]SFM48508.1 diguanylate cyclase (GGDEF) domain-containing protein [Methylobacterium pseudosasicola]